MNCSECKNKKPDNVPYIVHESITARMERQIKRLFIIVLFLIVTLVATNIAWFSYKIQFRTVESIEEYKVERESEKGINNSTINAEDVIDD